MANIKVAVRVRPISEREVNLTGSEIVVHTEPKTIALTNLKVSSNKAGDSRERTRRYGFDYCFDSSDPGSENYASQEKIYEALGETILDALFKRYNSCLVAYGQSASGKTYTMMGSKEDPGLTPRVCEGLFLRLADEEKSNGSFQVSVSYLEVYNERVRDLLRPSSNCVGLRVREHPRLGPYVQGLTHHAVPTLGSLISRVEEGTRARKTASTLQNPTSSRSHALLTLSLQPSSDNPGQSPTASAATPSSVVPRRNDFPRGSKLHLVDLAGSESAAACGGVNRLKEGANINKSLVALGNVISALADRGLGRSSPGRRFIPYRDSALTWLLKDVLGGNATTVMLATISPASGSYNETSHTLRFAQRAQSVINRPVINEDPVSRIIRELRAEVARLKSLLLEKNVNTDVDSTSSCLCGEQREEANCARQENQAINAEEREEDQPIVIIGQSRPPKRRYSTSETPDSGKDSPSPSRRFSSVESPEELGGSLWNFDTAEYKEAKVSEVFVNDEVDEPVFVDIPTLVAVLIKPDENIRVDSHQIEEICGDNVLDDGIDPVFRSHVGRQAASESTSSSSGHIDEGQTQNRFPPEVPISQRSPNCEEPSGDHQEEESKLQKPNYSSSPNGHINDKQSDNCYPSEVLISQLSPNSEEFSEDHDAKSKLQKPNHSSSPNGHIDHRQSDNCYPSEVLISQLSPNSEESSEDHQKDKSKLQKPNHNSSPNGININERQTDDCLPSEVLINQLSSNPDVAFSSPSHHRVRSKLRKQESIDGDLSSRRSTNLQTLKKYGSIEGLPRKTEVFCPVERSHTNLERRNGSSERIKKLNNIKEVEDPRLNSKPGNQWRNFGAWAARDPKGAVDSDKSPKDSNSCARVKNQSRKQSIEGLKRKTSKDSSSSGSKDELLVVQPRDRSSRKGSLDQEQIPARVHTPIQRARRAEIVAAVTERLYCSKKLAEDISNAATTASTPPSEGRSPVGSADVKLASATRMRLQEISRKMLAKRRRICADTQTDIQQTVRVRDASSLTDEPRIVVKDASILTDRHEDFESLTSTGHPVRRVKETSTITDPRHQATVTRCKDIGVVTDEGHEDRAVNSPRNDSGMVDDAGSYMGSNFFNGGASDLGGYDEGANGESVDRSTNTGVQTGPPSSGSQTRRKDLVEGCACHESRCCTGTRHCHGHGPHAPSHGEQSQKNVISISLPDMINITIESSNGLESKIRVFDGNESIDERTPISLQDNEAQTDSTDALEMATSTDEVFGQMRLDDFPAPARPIVPQTDAKSFRIENIFHEASARISPRIEIVADSSGDVKNSLTVTNSVGTFFFPETRENATDMERGSGYAFDDRFGSGIQRRLTANDFTKNTWPGQWRGRVPNSRRRSSQPASMADSRRSLSKIPMAQFDRNDDVLNSASQKGQRGCGYNDDGSIDRELGLRNDLPERKQAGKSVSNVGDGEASVSGLKTARTAGATSQIGSEQETNFSDDSLDPMEDVNRTSRETSHPGVEWTPDGKIGKTKETKGSKKACPPDVVAHTKKEINESATPNKSPVECEDFEDNQQVVFPKVKVDSKVTASFATPINDFKSLILGDPCFSTQDDEVNCVDSGDATSAVYRQNSECFHDHSARPNGPKSIIRRSSWGKETSWVADRSCGSRSSDDRSPCRKRVHFAVPEVFELPTSEEETLRNWSSDEEEEEEDEDETSEPGARNILEEYLDEAVVFMRNMNSMNEYMSAACALDKRAINERGRSRGRAKGSNYIEYNGRRISLDDQTDVNSEDEDLSFNVESYERCLRSMDRLEECLARVKRHDEILRDNYGIKVGGSTGAKLDLARSGVDPRMTNVGLGDESEYSRTAKSGCRSLGVVNGSFKGENNNLSLDESDRTYPGSDDDRGLEVSKRSRPLRNNHHPIEEGGTKHVESDDNRGLEVSKRSRQLGNNNLSIDERDTKHVGRDDGKGSEVSKRSRPRGFRFSDMRQMEPATYSQLRGRFSGPMVDTKTQRRYEITGVKVETKKVDGPMSERESPKSPDCCLILPRTTGTVKGASEGDKSRPRFTLSKYESSNESSSSTEALETFVESIDRAARSRDGFKHLGSPRSRFLQLLSERRRIVESTRNTGVS